MMTLQGQRAYPLMSFPTRIYNAILETIEIVQTTPVIAATSFLTGLSAAAGPLADWRHPATGRRHPSTLYLWVVALSGDRKSTTDALVCGNLYAHDEQAVMKHTSDIRAYETAHARWGAINRGLLARLAKLSRTGGSTAETEFELQRHAETAPTRPSEHRLIRQDISQRPVFEALEGDGKSIALITDEGQTLLDSSVMRHIGVLNRMWDGARLLTYDRADHDSIVVLNPRVTISMMIQPYVMDQFLAKRGAITHGSGHWARYLIARSPSIQGFRPITTKTAENAVSLPWFHARMGELMKKFGAMSESGSAARVLLEFDEAAKHLWFQIAAQVEADIRPGLYLSDISDFASKYMDIIGRIAALLHYFEVAADSTCDTDSLRQVGNISAETLIRARDIAGWHLGEYKCVFSPALHRSPEQIDADRLYSYLYRTCFVQQCFQVAKNLIRQNCGVRGSRYEPALALLAAQQAISIVIGKNRTQLIELNTQFFNAHPI